MPTSAASLRRLTPRRSRSARSRWRIAAPGSAASGMRDDSATVQSHSTCVAERGLACCHPGVPAATDDEPDALGGHVAGVEETVRRGGVEGDRVARAELVRLEAHGDTEPALDHMA